MSKVRARFDVGGNIPRGSLWETTRLRPGPAFSYSYGCQVPRSLIFMSAWAVMEGVDPPTYYPQDYSGQVRPNFLSREPITLKVMVSYLLVGEIDQRTLEYCEIPIHAQEDVDPVRLRDQFEMNWFAEWVRIDDERL